MSRKRPASDPPERPEEFDPLNRILQVLDETVAARQTLVVHSQSLQNCLRMADDLHRTMLAMHSNMSQRILTDAGDIPMRQLTGSTDTETRVDQRCRSHSAPNTRQH